MMHITIKLLIKINEAYIHSTHNTKHMEIFKTLVKFYMEKMCHTYTFMYSSTLSCTDKIIRVVVSHSLLLDRQ